MVLVIVGLTENVGEIVEVGELVRVGVVVGLIENVGEIVGVALDTATELSEGITAPNPCLAYPARW